MKSYEQRGSLYAIISGLLYGSLGYFGLNAIHGDLSPSTMLFWRFFISSGFIVVISIPALKRIKDSKSALLRAFFYGAFYYGLSTLLYFLACGYIGSGLSMVIFFTYPVMIMLFNYFLYNQQIPKMYYLAIAVILLGMAFLIDLQQMALDAKGLFLGVASAFFYAAYILFSKRNQILSPSASSLMVCLGCMMTALLVSCWNHTFTIPVSLVVWRNLLGIGVIATVLPILLMLHSLKYITSEKASILSVLEPIFVVLLGVLLLGESLNSKNILGIGLILVGAMITLWEMSPVTGNLDKTLSKSL